jgi:hypothetical protein
MQEDKIGEPSLRISLTKEQLDELSTQIANKLETPEYNSFQLKIITKALEEMNVSELDNGYLAVYNNLLDRFKNETPEYTRKECGCNKDEICFQCNPKEMLDEDDCNECGGLGCGKCCSKPSMDWEEELSKMEMVMEDGFYKGCMFYHESTKSLIEELITKAREEEREKCNCRDVSSWRNYGKKMGYWNYFAEEERDRLLEMLPEEAIDDTEINQYIKGRNDVLKEIKTLYYAQNNTQLVKRS